MKRMLIVIGILMLLTACTGTIETQPPVQTEPQTTEMISATAVVETTEAAEITSTESPTDTGTTTPETTVEPWQLLPVVPTVSQAMVEVYQRGLEMGRIPNRFSKIGDCQNITTYFLAMFDGGTYSLGDDYAYLQNTIDFYSGSWSRKSLAVHGGWNVAAIQNPLFANKEICREDESPLMCEVRVYNPSIAIVSMEESWSGSIDKYDTYLRQIVEFLLSENVVPILATRAEKLDQSRQINATIAKVAEDYQVPLWNFWSSVSTLPDYGLRADGFHLTEGKALFDDPESMLKGWPWRNLTALQAVDAVSHGIGAQP